MICGHYLLERCGRALSFLELADLLTDTVGADVEAHLMGKK